MYAHSTVPFAGTVYGGSSMTMSGLICQPSGQVAGGGASAGLPDCAPSSTHLLSVSISPAVRLRSFENVPCCGSANHGGIFFVCTAVLIARAHGRVLS